MLLRSPSGHRPDRRQARHAHILQIGLRLAIAQADGRPAMPISTSVRPPPDATTKHAGVIQPLRTRQEKMGGILRRESRHMPIETVLLVLFQLYDDQQYGIMLRAARVKRIAEMYQWVEYEHRRYVRLLPVL